MNATAVETEHVIEAEVFFNWTDGYPLNVAWRIECRCGWRDEVNNAQVPATEQFFDQPRHAFQKHVTKVRSGGVIAAGLNADTIHATRGAPA